MVNRDELRDWINRLSQDSCIGIDEGGLCLQEVAPDNTMTGVSLEIGGIPEEIENAGPSVPQPDEVY